jgi:hypothetical protein
LQRALGPFASFQQSALSFLFLLRADLAVRGVFARHIVGTDQGRP